jgi:hypothetical protein
VSVLNEVYICLAWSKSSSLSVAHIMWELAANMTRALSIDVLRVCGYEAFRQFSMMVVSCAETLHYWIGCHRLGNFAKVADRAAYPYSSRKIGRLADPTMIANSLT